MKSKTSRIWIGILVANAFAMAVMGLTAFVFTYLYHYSNGAGTQFFIYSDFIIIPMAMGIICAWFWKDLELKNGYYLVNALLAVIVAILCSFLFLGEGVICLIIVSPLLMAFIVAGVFIGKVMFQKKNNKLNVSALSVLVIIFTVDSLSEHHYENLVTDTIIIHAAPAEVWKHVASFEPITEPNHYFLFRLGMPSPVQSTVDGYYEGADRKCIFSNGYVFDEKMVVYKPSENLTFDIISQPRDPEIMGHIDIKRGQFLLHDNGDGTTTLTGNSWYQLYVFPVWYYDLWAQSITRNVHTRVMQHIKELSEKK